VLSTDTGLGALVTLIGRDGAEEIIVDEVVGWASTLNYEILYDISKRVPRILRDAPVTNRP
jgi:alanine racemase